MHDRLTFTPVVPFGRVESQRSSQKSLVRFPMLVAALPQILSKPASVVAPVCTLQVYSTLGDDARAAAISAHPYTEATRHVLCVLQVRIPEAQFPWTGDARPLDGSGMPRARASEQSYHPDPAAARFPQHCRRRMSYATCAMTPSTGKERLAESNTQPAPSGTRVGFPRG